MDTEPDNNINAFQQTCFGQFTITYITNVWKLSSFSKLFCKFNHDFTQKITIVIVLFYFLPENKSKTEIDWSESNQAMQSFYFPVYKV